MKCPGCGRQDNMGEGEKRTRFKVNGTKPGYDHKGQLWVIIRYRECLKCGCKFKTKEEVERPIAEA